MWYIMDKLLVLPGIIIGLSFHEAAHAAMSNALGDPTPRMQGRLTLNPLAHIDVIGFIFLIIAGFGWGKPVMVDPSYYKNKRRDEFLVSIAGVSTNLVLAIVFSFITRAVGSVLMPMEHPSILIQAIYLMLYYAVMMNLVLMIFNLIPVPPLDGFGLVTQIFNLEKHEWYWKLYRYGSVILALLIIFNITDMVITPAISFMLDLLKL